MDARNRPTNALSRPAEAASEYSQGINQSPPFKPQAIRSSILYHLRKYQEFCSEAVIFHIGSGIGGESSTDTTGKLLGQAQCAEMDLTRNTVVRPRDNTKTASQIEENCTVTQGHLLTSIGRLIDGTTYLHRLLKRERVREWVSNGMMCVSRMWT